MSRDNYHRKGQKHDLGKPYNENDDLDPENMDALAELITRVPDLAVVISSSWRLGRTLDQLRALLHAAVPPGRVIGVTPRLESRLRHEEIRRWIEDNPLIVGPAAHLRFLAFDDDTFDMVPLGDAFLHVHRSTGLTFVHVEKAVAYFRAPAAK